jgi:outer membrane protein OmpA-like peptidoglycan-associated protein
MSIHGKIFGVDIAATIGLLLLTTASAMVQAQLKTQAHDQAQAQTDTTGAATTTSTVATVSPFMAFAPASSESSSADTTALPDGPAPMQDQMPPVSAYPTGLNASDHWRVGISLYGWFAGLHGNLGVQGHNAGIHVPFSSLFDALRFEIPIAVEADKGRFVMPIDFLWMKFRVDNGIPENDFGQTSISSRFTQSMLTPKFGYRLIDADHLKFDALGGLRYWYINLNNSLEPSNLSYARSVNFIDGLGGGRFILPFSEKAAITVAGDAGAGSSNLDYQVLGLLNMNLNPKFGVALGWRYLYENYRPGTNEFVYNPTISGVIAGLDFNLGGKPPIPPTASCSVSPAEVYAGDPVTATATPVGLNPKLSVVYSWTGDGVTGNGPTASVNTSAMNPGTYPVRGEVKEGKPGKEGEKPWQVASCSTSLTVKPFQPPTISCSATPTNLNPGDSAPITAQGVSPQNRPLTYTYQASSGTISGSGATATYSSTGASAGPVQVTCSVSDDKGHLATAGITLTVQAPPPSPEPEVVARLRLHSVYFPTAQPTVKHPDGGLVDSQKAILTALAADFTGYLQVKPDARITLTGHADPRGTPEFNQQLSERRVARAKAFLVEHGVPEASIDTEAKGDEQPLSKDEVQDLIQTDPDLTDEQRTKLLRNLNVIVLAQNRRVDIRLNGSDDKSKRHYPFNAADSSTLLDLQKPVHMTARRRR